MSFNENANPKVKTEKFKIYLQVGGTAAEPTWELQGKGIESWTVDQNQDITKTPDVLGFVEMERGAAQQTQSGIALRLRKGSKLAEMLFDAWFGNDMSALDAVSILQKFEFVDAETTGYCLARLQKNCMIAINNFSGEASGYLGFDIDIHYSGDITTGSMLKEDGETITFVPDSEDEPEVVNENVSEE